MKAAINELMWSEEAACWQDLLLVQRGGTGTGGGRSSGTTGSAATSGGAGGAGAAAEAAADSPDATRGTPSAGVPGRAGSGPWVTERLPRCYASNWLPLWCGCCDRGSDVAHAAVAGLQASGLIAEGGRC